MTRAAARTVVCVHGLTRNAHDFDALAAALAARGCRVSAVDIAGRGRQRPAGRPRAVRRAGLRRAHGPASGASGPVRRRLGRHLDGRPDRHGAGGRRALRRWRGWSSTTSGRSCRSRRCSRSRPISGSTCGSKDLAELEAHLRKIHGSFGPLTDAQWHKLALGSARETAEGWRLHYDPAIREVFDAASGRGHLGAVGPRSVSRPS